MRDISSLYAREQAYWKDQNIALFGVEPINWLDSFSHIQISLDEDCKQYWNTESPCELAVFLNGRGDRDSDKKMKNSYRLAINPYNFCIDVFASYNTKNGVKECKICAIPTPSEDLSWIINRSKYVPRITAKRNNNLNGFVRYNDGTVKGEGYTFSTDTGTFTCFLKKNPFEPTHANIIARLTPKSRLFLESLLHAPLTEDNLVDAFRLIPEIEPNSIFNYHFTRIGYFKDIIFNSKKVAKPLTKGLLGINTMIASEAPKRYSHEEGSLVLSNGNPLFALENFRTVINIYEGTYKPAFTYTDTIGFFDSFKTVTSKTAGRQRLLLDNITVHKGILWVQDEDTGVERPMYDYIGNPPRQRLSVLSYAPFCNNNKPKRIMMNAKLSAQSVPLADEIDNLTHRVMARTGFADIEGYSYADSIIISTSFAERLRTYEVKMLYLNYYSSLYDTLESMYERNDSTFTLDLLRCMFPNTAVSILDGYENISIDEIERINEDLARVFISYEIPFRKGDKLTNLHGAKGTVGLILPDEKMPRLLNPVGNMDEGPLEIIFSGFSTIRRGTLGQIFEAWSNASGITLTGNEFVSTAISQYYNEMLEYADNSIVEYNGNVATMPVGLVRVMRLYHHANTHLSEAPLDTPRRGLALGEMEKLNLVANDCPNILKELAYRGSYRYLNMHKLAKDIESTRELPCSHKTVKKERFGAIIKSLGYEVFVDGMPLVPTDYTSVLDSEEDTNIFNNVE